jgi:hypothetical protein
MTLKMKPTSNQKQSKNQSLGSNLNLQDDLLQSPVWNKILARSRCIEVPDGLLPCDGTSAELSRRAVEL